MYSICTSFNFTITNYLLHPRRRRCFVVAGDDASVTSINPAVAAGPGGADDWVSYIDETTGEPTSL